ncbi:MAG TPA: lysophospholipid acyltransferase family protein [Polyangia bacterium]
MIDPATKAALAALVETLRERIPDPATLPDFGFDPEFLNKTAPVLEFLWSKYFRIRLTGMENVPADGAALLVANHSGGLPYDGAMLIHATHRYHPASRPLRPLVANFAFHSPWLRPVVARIGGVRASMQNALALCKAGQLIGVFPEGLRGVGKLYRERYRLTHFGRGGFVRLARTALVPILPVAIVGAEETHPVLARLTRIAAPLGLPYIPITPTFPLLGPLGLLPVPTKWSIKIGEPIMFPPVGTNEENKKEENLEMAEMVRSKLDHMIAELLAARRSVLFG